MASVEENKLRKRSKILEAAYELFSSKGINTTAIDEVVKKAGVAKGTFYLYFRDKYDLTDQIVLYKSTELVRQVLEEVRIFGNQKRLSALDQILLFIDKMLDAMSENREILTLVSTRISTIYDLLMHDENTEFRDNMEALCALLQELGYTHEQAIRHLYVMINMLCSVCCNAILSGVPYTIDELRPEIHVIVQKLLS